MELEMAKYEVKNRVAYITLNAPKTLNAICPPLIRDVCMAMKEAEQDDNVKVIVLNATGKAFCAGGDLGFFYKGLKEGSIDMGPLMKDSMRIPMAIKKSAKPYICAARGAIAGAGCSLNLCCDFTFISDTAIFIEAFVGIGLLPDTGGVYLLSRAIGSNRAAQLALTGEPIKAEKMMAMGLAYKMVPDQDLDEKVSAFAERLAKGPATSYQYIKKMIYENDFADFETYFDREAEYQKKCAEHPDFKEGVSAFVEKRKPQFK